METQKTTHSLGGYRHGASRAPKVSVIMPMYNAMPFLKQAIGSILYQTFQDFELLVVDNGSTDGSLDYVQSLSDPRIRTVSEPNRGSGNAITTGIWLAQGEFLAVMDSDDVADRSRLRIEVEFLDSHPDIVLVGSRFAFLIDSRVVDVPPQPREHHHIMQALLQGRPVICNSSTMFRAAEARAVGGHRLPGPGHDLDFFLRMGEVGKLYNIPDVLHFYTLHGASTSIVRMAEVNRWHAFSVACAKARLDGAKEPDKSTFFQQWEHRTMAVKLAEAADCKSLLLYRKALMKRAIGKEMVAAAIAFFAAMLNPRRTSWHLRRKLGLC